MDTKQIKEFLQTKTGNFYKVPKKATAKDRLRPITKKELAVLYRKSLKGENIDISQKDKKDIEKIIFSSNISPEEIVAFEATDINEQWHWTINKEFALNNYNINENIDLNKWNKEGFKEVFKKPKPINIAPLTVAQIKQMNFKFNGIDMSIPKEIKDMILNGQLDDNDIPGVLAQNPDPKNKTDIWFIPIEHFTNSYDVSEKYFNDDNIKEKITGNIKYKSQVKQTF